MSENEKKAVEEKPRLGRKVYLLREVEVTMTDIKKNDLFRMEKASPVDTVNPNEWFIAESDAAQDEGNKEEFTVSATPIAFIKNEMYRVGSRFGLAPPSILKLMSSKKKGKKS